MYNRGPNRSHVEVRSYDVTPPRQCVADDSSDKKAPRPIREVNQMTKALAALVGKADAQ
jgi:hypothetical protein